MAKIDYIKLSKPRNDGKAELIVRLYVTKTFRPQFRSGLYLNPQRFISLDSTDRCRRYEIDIPSGKSSVSCPLKPSDSTPLKHSTMPP